MLFVLSFVYFVGLAITAVAVGYLTEQKPAGFALLGVGFILYAVVVGLTHYLNQKS